MAEDRTINRQRQYTCPACAKMRTEGAEHECNYQTLPGGLGRVLGALQEAGPEPASERQVGGNHYRKFKIQPWDVIDEYELTFYAGSVLKYLLRAGHKGSKLEDLKKARHYLDKMIELEETGE